MPSEARAIPAAALMSLALGVLGCSSPDSGSDAGAGTGGTGAGGSATSGSGGTGGSSGASGGSGAGGTGAVGGSAGGTGPTGATAGMGGTSGMPSGGAGAGGSDGGLSGSGGMAGTGMGGVGGASGGGAGGAGGAVGGGGSGASGGKAGGGSGGNAGGGAGGKAGAGGSGGTPNCTTRTGGALIDFRVCNQTMRFWITNNAFITEAIRLRGNGQSRIACFPQPMDGRDCDPLLTYHANPANAYWTDFELETYFTCPEDVESDKDFWLGQVGQFCGEMTTVTAVDDNR